MSKNFLVMGQGGMICRPLPWSVWFGRTFWLMLIAAVLLALRPAPLFAEQSVQLDWDPNPDPIVVGYNIYYGTASGDYSEEVSVGSVSSAILIGLTEGTTYYIVATSRDAEGQESPPSDEISYTVPIGSTSPPADPPDLSLADNQMGDDSISLEWDPRSDPNVVGYNIYYGTESGDYFGEISVENMSNAVITNLVPGTTYFIVATACDAAGQESPPSEEISYALSNVVTPPATNSTNPVLSLVSVPMGDGTSSLYLTATGNMPDNWSIESSTDLISWNWLQDGYGPFLYVPISTTDAPQMFFRLTARVIPDLIVPPTILMLAPIQLDDGTSAIILTGSGNVPAYWIIESSTDLQNWNWYVDGTDPGINVEIPISPDTPQMFFRLVSP